MRVLDDDLSRSGEVNRLRAARMLDELVPDGALERGDLLVDG